VIEVTRRYAFSAAHILREASLSDAENRAIYGKCANPNGHGHNYGVEVTLTGPVDARTGRIISPDLLDRIFEERVASRFATRLLNEDEAFRERVPTAENIALAIHEAIADEVAKRTSAEVRRVKIVETRRNSFTSGAIE